MATYLKRNDWHEAEEKYDGFRVFFKGQEPSRAELVLPESGVADYPYRMAEAIGLLSGLEDRSPGRVIDSIRPRWKALLAPASTALQVTLAALVVIVAILALALSARSMGFRKPVAPWIEISHPADNEEVLFLPGFDCRLDVVGQAHNLQPRTDALVALRIRPHVPAGAPWYGTGLTTPVQSDGSWSLSGRIASPVASSSDRTSIFDLEVRLLKDRTIGPSETALLLDTATVAIVTREVDAAVIAPGFAAAGALFFTYPTKLPVRVGIDWDCPAPASTAHQGYYLEYLFRGRNPLSEEGWGYTFRAAPSFFDVGASENLVVSFAGFPSSARFIMKLEDSEGSQGIVGQTLSSSWRTVSIPIAEFKQDQPSLRLDSIAQVTVGFPQARSEMSLRVSAISME